MILILGGPEEHVFFRSGIQDIIVDWGQETLSEVGIPFLKI